MKINYFANTYMNINKCMHKLLRLFAGLCHLSTWLINGQACAVLVPIYWNRVKRSSSIHRFKVPKQQQKRVRRNFKPIINYMNYTSLNNLTDLLPSANKRSKNAFCLCHKYDESSYPDPISPEKSKLHNICDHCCVV